jgi:hypothetical protein
MSVRISAVTLAIAAIIVVITPTFVVSPQLAYSQQTSSANLNFQTWGDAGNLHTVAIPTNWLGPGLNAGQTITYYQSPDKSQTVMLTAYDQVTPTLEQFVENQLKSISSSRGEPLQYYQVLWGGKYPAIGLVFPNYVTYFILANGIFYNIAAQGAVLNNQNTVPIIHNIFNSFTIYTPEEWATQQRLQATQNQMRIEANRQLQDSINQGKNEISRLMTEGLSCLSGTLSHDTYGNAVCER